MTKLKIAVLNTLRLIWCFRLGLSGILAALGAGHMGWLAPDTVEQIAIGVFVTVMAQKL